VPGSTTAPHFAGKWSPPAAQPGPGGDLSREHCPSGLWTRLLIPKTCQKFWKRGFRDKSKPADSLLRYILITKQGSYVAVRLDQITAPVQRSKGGWEGVCAWSLAEILTLHVPYSLIPHMELWVRKPGTYSPCVASRGTCLPFVASV